MPLKTSQEFHAPLVRVRGQLARDGRVRWSPCLRTFKGEDDTPPGPTVAPKLERLAPVDVPAHRARLANELKLSKSHRVIEFQDRDGNVLERAAVDPQFLAKDREWARFSGRLPYHGQTARVVLLDSGKELGTLAVSSRLPAFELLAPMHASDIDARGILHLRWKPVGEEKQSITYYVRYGWGDERWARPGVNLSSHEFELDLRQMPGGAQCVVQVIGTNGYQTAYVETPRFEVPLKAPRLLIGDVDGPRLFAQGYSLENGPLVGRQVSWYEGPRLIASGASFDVRTLGRGVHHIRVETRDDSGRITEHVLGDYEGVVGRRLLPKPGL